MTIPLMARALPVLGYSGSAFARTLNHAGGSRAKDCASGGMSPCDEGSLIPTSWLATALLGAGSDDLLLQEP